MNEPSLLSVLTINAEQNFQRHLFLITFFSWFKTILSGLKRLVVAMHHSFIKHGIQCQQKSSQIER